MTSSRPDSSPTWEPSEAATDSRTPSPRKVSPSTFPKQRGLPPRGSPQRIRRRDGRSSRRPARDTTSSPAHLKAINIRFHDWRRTAGSRFMPGMSPHYVQRFLDQANLSTTSRYLKIDQQGMHNALRAVDEARGEDTQCDTQSADAK